ncbi:hypothetical protein Lsan_1849 [Legionella santicrucis]|uniref:Uncharacterized protein n=1 Tax=Legionella santicrucis TaxID=45074 RepID=A0A0W0YWN5_9GAMM|nr:hypothetical protein [Legionella santicrucis]KTD61287.1 hypothetical protein Lsan_1849 [Legionella santicrucis]
MPKAFTHLCKNVNLSLYDNTLTVYSKSKMPPINNQLDLLMVLLFSQMDCVSAKINDMFDMDQNELGVYRFVHREDSDHALYHQDNLDMDYNHYHAQFSKTIDEIKLEDILGILEKHTLITSEEHTSFLKAYHEANTLSDVPSSKKEVVKEQEKSNVVKSITPSETLPVKKKDDELTFGGFKRGFFLTPLSKPVVAKKDDQNTFALYK